MQILTLVLLGVIMLMGGILIMQYGLRQLLGHKLRDFISALALTPWRGLLAGMASAALMQSSTAVSLIVIGLVSAEYLTFRQSLGLILGANIGTCSTVQLMVLTVPDRMAFPILICSLLIAAAVKKLRYPALVISGLSSMFAGLSLLSGALGNLPHFETVLAYIGATDNNPLYGVLSGIILTFLFQSSSAATGMLMTLAADGLVDLATVAYIIYGNNIGSCLSSVVVGTAAPLSARRVAMSHIVLNVLGVMAFLPFTNILTGAAALISDNFAAQVAVIHTLFNVVSSLAVMPVINFYARLIIFLVPDRT